MNDEPEQGEMSNHALRSLIAVAWVGFFVFAFFRWGPTFPLPLDGESLELTRTDIVSGEVGIAKISVRSMLGNVLLDNMLGGTDPKTEGWRFIQWRLILTAAGLLLGMLALGRLFIRLLRIEHESTPRMETSVFAYGLGVSATSLIVLGFGLAGILQAKVFVGILSAAVLLELILVFANRRTSNSTLVDEPTSRAFVCACLVLVAPVLLMIVLGALSPPTDFDVREYHLQGPKEYFQNGQITFLPHNAYTSFPFLTEMLALLGMVVTSDWYTGALLGKLLLAAFAPMTALAIVAAGRRCFDSKAGWLGAVIFLTTPWIYRISIIAYAEGGLAFFLFMSVLAVSRFAHHRSGSNALLTGLMCGSAMACKYPALLSVVAPVGLTIGWLCWKRTEPNESVSKATIAKTIVVFGVGVAVAVGPWLIKNLVETGNPVYPLAYSIFGGTDWTPEINARWKTGHSPPNHKLTDLTSRVADVTIRSDWMNALLFAFAPLALLASLKHRRAAIGFWLFALWMFGSWWLFTHRIDRFWVPIIPVLAILAGVGLHAVRTKPIRFMLQGVLVLGVGFNTLFCVSPWSGYNAWFQDPEVARQTGDQQAAMLLRAEAYNERSSKPGRVLCVGEAAVFEARSDVVYNTVFDLNIFQEICGQSVSGGLDLKVERRPAEEIRSRFQERDITYIYVNWQEILRYKAPGSYGFSFFVQPWHFQKLVEAGVLQRMDVVKRDFNSLSEFDQSVIVMWNTRDENQQYVAQEIYRVIATPSP
jgi:4-amino-4-deoxy-L-arabinose transferase-like glycosyltransferase